MVVVAIVLALIASFVHYAVDRRSKQLNVEVEARNQTIQSLRDDLSRQEVKFQAAITTELLRQKAAFIEDQTFLVKDRVGHLVNLLAAAFAEPKKSKRCILAAQSRTAILGVAAELVGRSAVQGTRANIFTFEVDELGSELLRPLQAGHAGRQNGSKRELRSGDATFDATENRDWRFVPSTGYKDVETGRALEYGTYLTYPIMEDCGDLYGALTVDCLEVGDLDESVDVAWMSVFAAMLAMTFRAAS